eukprot:6878209-Prymnesium_polylepis.1
MQRGQVRFGRHALSPATRAINRRRHRRLLRRRPYHVLISLPATSTAPTSIPLIATMLTPPGQPWCVWRAP